MTTNIYRGRESKTLEFKSTIKKFDAIIKTCIAFANGVGGKIVIGINDNTQNIIGINDEIRDKIYDDFPNSLYDSTSPHLISQIYEQRFNEHAVLVIEIPPSLKKPCFLRRDGLPKGVYLRIGSSTRRANEEYIEELMRENQRVSYDEEPIHLDTAILQRTQLSDYYSVVSKEALLEDKIITRSAANAETYYPTVAGILLFAEFPDKHIPEAHIICTRFSGDEGRNIVQTEEIKGPLNKQIDVGFNLVLSWIKRDYHLVGAKMKSKTLIPPEALREAITNAVIHRKYWIAGATKIALYDDHIEIFSPGNFPGHIDICNLGEGITHLRNPIIGRMAHKMEIIEKLGSGIKLIFDSCLKLKIVPPEYNENGDYVKVIFRFQPLKDERKSDEEILLNYFKTSPTLTIHDMVGHLGRSKNTVFKVLNNLIDKGIVKRIGKGRATRYSLK